MKMRSKRPISYEEAKARAGALCSRCEQCSPDLLKKFQTWGLSQGDANRLITELKRLRWVDDTRYARAFAHDKVSYSGWGRHKIAAALAARRLPRDAVECAFDDVEEEEYEEVALRVVRAKVRSIKAPLSDYETKAKVYRFAMSRGFETSLVSRIVARVAAEQAEEAEAEAEDE